MANLGSNPGGSVGNASPPQTGQEMDLTGRIKRNFLYLGNTLMIILN